MKLFTAFETDEQFLHYRVTFGLTNAVSVFQKIMNIIRTDNSLSATFAYTDDVIVCGSNQEEYGENLKSFEVAGNYNLSLNDEKCY